MNRYEKLKEFFFQSIDEHCHGIYKQKAMFHSLQVSTLCQMIAINKHLDIELAMIIGLFHDFSQFINHSSFDHSSRSQMLLSPHLQDDFSIQEQQIICTAIKNHSDKQRIDDPYSELVKDADILAQYFNEPDIILNDVSQKRLNIYIK